MLKYRMILLVVYYFFITLISTFCQSFNLNSPLYFPRIEASPQAKEFIRQIKNQLEAWDLPYQQFDFAETSLQHSFSSCLEVTIKGQKADTLIVCAPLSHPIDVDIENSGYLNIVLALRLLSAAKERSLAGSLPVTLKVLFLGAEFGENDEPGYPLGSRLFLENYYPEEPVNVLYLNFRRVPETIIVRCGAPGLVCPYWFIKRCTNMLSQEGLSFHMKGDENQLFRAGFITKTTLIEPFLRAGYPAISFESEPLVTANLEKEEEEEWIKTFETFFWSFLDTYQAETPEKWDRHYLTFQLGNVFFIIPEQVYLILCLAVFGMLILYIQLNTQLFIHYLIIIFKNIRILLVMFVLLFIFFLVATWLIEAILYIRDNDLIWQVWPLLLFFLKFIFTLLFFFLAYKQFHHLVLPHSTRFYSLSALFLVSLNTIILSLINLSLSIYFLWAFCCLFFVFLLHNRYLKIILTILSLFFVGKVVFDFFTLPELEFVKIFLLSPLKGNILLTFFIFPYVLLIIYLSSYFHLSESLAIKMRRIGFTTLSVFIGALLVYIIFVSPFTAHYPQPVKVTETVDLDAPANVIQITSGAALSRMEYWNGTQLLYFDPRAKNFTLPLSEVPQLVAYEIKKTTFLARQNIRIELKPLGNPYKIDLKLTSEDEFILYDSNYPSNKSFTGKDYTITVGKHPPIPLRLEFTLPQRLNLELDLNITYLNFPFSFEVSGKDMKISKYLIVKKKIQVQT